MSGFDDRLPEGLSPYIEDLMLRCALYTETLSDAIEAARVSGQDVAPDAQRAVRLARAAAYAAAAQLTDAVAHNRLVACAGDLALRAVEAARDVHSEDLLTARVALSERLSDESDRSRDQAFCRAVGLQQTLRSRVCPSQMTVAAAITANAAAAYSGCVTDQAVLVAQWNAGYEAVRWEDPWATHGLLFDLFRCAYQAATGIKIGTLDVP